jgi:hypothetical protein
MSNLTPTLEQKIAAALTLADITSSDLDKLIAEAEAAAQFADENATKAREQALDPALTVDVVKVGAEVAAAELSRDRLRAALPRLRMRCTEIRRQEDVAAWKAEAEKLVATRDALLMEFMRILPAELTIQIAEQLSAMRKFDKEIDALNYRRPNDQSLRSLHYATPELARELRIPNMEVPGTFLWPPPTSYAELLAAIPTDPFIIAEAAKGTYENARYKRILEDNRRQIAEAEQRQREFEKRQAAEAEAAKERDRHAYVERGRPV